MRAFVITLSNNAESFEQADVLIDSSNHVQNDFTIEKFIATTPDNVVETFLEEKIKWNYPWTTEIMDLATGLKKTPYQTADPKKRMACFMSHYRLWKKCAEDNEALIVLEHDAKFIRKLDIDLRRDTSYDVVSLNDPRGATRKSAVYHELISGKIRVSPVPWLDDINVPQGLPGNSAYYITPKGAEKLLSLVKEYGAWPNDAIMCKQLMPRMLGCLGEYVTVIQGTSASTTTK
tara:strand:+ start:1621 stop:2319 length:699 start_codon:yes stop_codon:yes gene_type:complete